MNISNLKVGDAVIHINGQTGNRSLATVAKVTKTQITVGKTRFTRSHGNEVGGSTYSSHIQVGTAEEVAQVKREMLRRRLEKYLCEVNWAQVSLESITRIVEMVQKDMSWIESQKKT